MSAPPQRDGLPPCPGPSSGRGTRKTSPQADDTTGPARDRPEHVPHHHRELRLDAMPRMTLRRLGRRKDGAAPVVLPTFTAAALAMVAVVVAIGRSGSDLADFAAVALLLGLLAVLMAGLAGLLRDGEGEDRE
jgi:hypothetical protein